MPKTEVKTDDSVVVRHTYSQKQKRAMDAYLNAHQAVADFEHTLLSLISNRRIFVCKPRRNFVWANNFGYGRG